MRKQSLVWQLFPSYLLVTLAALLAITGYSAQAVRNFYHEQAAKDLKSRAALVSGQVHERIRDGDFASIQDLCNELGPAADTRITIILPSGVVAGDSEENPGDMDNHAGRPEVREALMGCLGSSMRFSKTVNKQMMYVAVPLMADTKVDGVVRVAIPITAIDDALWSILSRIAYGGGIVALLAAGVSWGVSRRITRPLAELRQGAERFARGALDQPLTIPDSLEIGALAESMNTMARELDERIKTAIRQKNELDAVLASMVEGVLAVDNHERLIIINQTAAGLLDVDAEAVLGKYLPEIVRNSTLEQFIEDTLSSEGMLEREIVFHQHGERLFQGHGTVLHDTQENASGAVVVLNDITRLRRLENVRREFVANVSHELKTPITSIKGFVETLLDSTPEDPADVERFHRIIAKQADQLGSLIDDLLTLSRLEQEEKPLETIAQIEALRPTLEKAVLRHVSRAADKGVRIELHCDDALEVRINQSLITQCIVNLLDNAIMYSERDGVVCVTASREGDDVVVSVRDEGCGVAPEHLPRLFERFYRVDKARSRELGGTGLGLAIVKHIVELHGGHVEAKSTLGAGSVFSVYLPANTSQTSA
ncbi:MAG: HAMP domain-containing protein [Nitrospiraceae bacterium]|nr:HAMP domain-containing protein [Nitrospiraceae bacterium]